MAQHDYVIDNGPGLAVRTDINAVLQAIVTNNAGNIEPQAMFPGMMWLDTSTTPPVIRQRNQGNTGWDMLLPIGFVRRSAITSSTTAFQYDASTTWAEVEVVGAGAGGRNTGGATSGAGLASVGSGGGGGGYTKKSFPITPTIRSATKTIVIGVGQANANGGNSQYSDTVNNLSGGGGIAGVIPSAWSGLTNHYQGGPGGSSSGGDVNIAGGAGQAGSCFGQNANGVGVASAIGGTGGVSAIGGQGGQGAAIGANNTNYSLNGGATNSWGAGGGGAAGINLTSNMTGGGAGNGVVIITEYR